ncbi:hypothetical protein CKAN_00407400 [Cinnamomum micranthum f. kanehirae]|uniref:Uncharacterized protein n=1 Tax=Cinnamomum micranthum f. kanehirae TaxID=337451 RepID=A0A3S3NAC1_9MAGN|nr:hypothetical protein CKAN_00407400 [Cinnamomum micranthum f. kanehirae]
MKITPFPSNVFLGFTSRGGEAIRGFSIGNKTPCRGLLVEFLGQIPAQMHSNLLTHIPSHSPKTLAISVYFLGRKYF